MGARVKPIFFDFLSSLAAKQGMGKNICILYGNERRISRMDFAKKIHQTDIILFMFRAHYRYFTVYFVRIKKLLLKGLSIKIKVSLKYDSEIYK